MWVNYGEVKRPLAISEYNNTSKCFACLVVRDVPFGARLARHQTAAQQFNTWWDQLPPRDITIFSDGSEQRVEGDRRVTYGFAVYQDKCLITTGRGSLNPETHVFNAEAVGAWRGLEQVARLIHTGLPHTRIWICIDSTSVIWCLRGTAPVSSQWAFLQCQETMELLDARVRWSPGHTGILGNEEADRLANLEAKHPTPPTGLAANHSASGIRSVAKSILRSAQQEWWSHKKAKLSSWYTQWKQTYDPSNTPEALQLSRRQLARLIALKARHGDFAWYHTKFQHDEARLHCSCGRIKTPEHLVLCRKVRSTFARWPLRPLGPPQALKDAIVYLRNLSA
ncbi:hypothetical protein J1614_012278 [Plenodomus biglobosus]|nr:hypothetical protein J1614_012278 [Plenodomus biglobosus]